MEINKEFLRKLIEAKTTTFNLKRIQDDEPIMVIGIEINLNDEEYQQWCSLDIDNEYKIYRLKV